MNYEELLRQHRHLQVQYLILFAVTVLMSIVIGFLL